MAVRVIGKRYISENSIAIYINDGIYHAFNKVATDGVTLDNQRLFFTEEEQSKPKPKVDKKDEFILLNNEVDEVGEINATIYGHTCDGLDIVAKNVVLPDNIEIGDWFCFGGMGAYTHSLVSAFNSMISVQQILVLDEV